FHFDGAALRGHEHACLACQTHRQPAGDVSQCFRRAAGFSRRPPRPDPRLALRVLHLPEIRQTMGSATETIWSTRIALIPRPRPTTTEKENRKSTRLNSSHEWIS